MCVDIGIICSFIVFFRLLIVLVFNILLPGTTGLGAAAYSTFRSIIAVLVLCGFAYGGLQVRKQNSFINLFLNSAIYLPVYLYTKCLFGLSFVIKLSAGSYSCLTN